MSELRILVLTSSTGGGHDARAEAFAEWCFQLYRHKVDVRIEQMLEKSSVLNRAGVDFYNWIQRRLPALHTLYYAVIEGLSILNRRSVVFGRAYYEKVLREYRPHLVFSVHDCLNRGYFQLARKILGPEKVRCATYCGEFSGGWGYSINWIEPSVDLYLSRTPTARDYAVKKGLSPERCRVRGHLMRPRAHLEVLPGSAERAAFRTKKLGLRPDLFTLFLATGGNGANNHLELLPALARHAGRCQAIAICGRNREIYNDLVHWRALHPDFDLYLEGYSEIVHLLLQASDAVVTRGGTTTCAKALHYRCPIVFNAFGGVMPQESLTWKFFRNGGCEKIENAADFGALIDRWMADPSDYARLRENFLRLRYEEDPTIVIDELVQLAEEAAGIRLTRHPFPPANGNGFKPA
ncbi:MAG TPA: glycosyltransferase [Opitutaceae bacterium]|nr:glycosyltransferase [Opitutaceae bacterium]